MTEITDNTARHAPHILPFVLAAFAPLIPRLATLHLGNRNGVNALSAVQNGPLLGALPWIIYGLPALAWAIHRHGNNAPAHIGAALLAVLIPFATLLLLCAIMANGTGAFLALFYLIFGLPLAVLWACIFNVIYRTTAALIR